MRDKEITLAEVKEKTVMFINLSDKNHKNQSRAVISLKGDSCELSFGA
jgi:hypothetical protein